MCPSFLCTGLVLGRENQRCSVLLAFLSLLINYVWPATLKQSMSSLFFTLFLSLDIECVNESLFLDFDHLTCSFVCDTK